MNLVRVHRTFSKLKSLKARQYSQPALQDQNEYTEKPEYPAIQDLSLQARKLRDREAVYEKIKKVKTVEEKQIALNMPKYYGWKCVIFKDDKVPYNAMPMIQHYTRSHFIQTDKLPEIYAETSNSASFIAKEIKADIEDIISIEHSDIKRNFNYSTELPEAQQKENALSSCIVRQINRAIMNNIANKYHHILTAQVDYNPRHEAFWMVGGVDPPKSVVNWRKRFDWLKDRKNESIDRPVQYLGSPLLALRHKLPLKPIIPYSEAENPAFKVPKFDYYPETTGYMTEHRHGTNIPGFWPGEIDEHGLLSIQGRGHILDRKPSFGPEDNLEALHCQAIKSSFAWLLAQANYHGFNTYNDITYPLTTQTIITNGQLWSFYAFQLNTIAMHNDQVDINPKSNVCFGTEPCKLYEAIENGKVIGFNADVLKMIIQLYLNTPEKRDYDMKPYLDKEEQVVADIEDDNKRCWLENTYKHIVSNRPKHYLIPEIYHWEYIYKIQHNTRFFERKVRPFARGINPFKRKLSDHLPPYIPKVLRPYPKCRKKFETTYYPDV